MKFTKIPQETFQNMQLNAGILLYDFDPENVPDDDTIYANMFGATSGGISVNANPTYSDLGEDIDNCPKNTKELKHLDSWEVTISGTLVAFDEKGMVFTLAAADVDDKGNITLRNDLDSDKDFKDLWWVGDYNQGNGFVAFKVKNALSTGGLQIQSTDQEKGTADFEFTGHYSIYAQDEVPLECYLCTDYEEQGDNGGDTEPDDENP